MSTVTRQFNVPRFKWLQISMILLVLAGLGVSAYLMWGYTVPGATLACGSSGGCEAVKNSPYANLMGIPIPVYGLVCYGFLLAALVGQGHPAIERKGWTPYLALSIFGVALVGVLFSAYLTYLSYFVIFAVCRWCIASAIIMTAIFGLSIANLQQSNQA